MARDVQILLGCPLVFPDMNAPFLEYGEDTSHRSVLQHVRGEGLEKCQGDLPAFAIFSNSFSLKCSRCHTFGWHVLNPIILFFFFIYFY